tara:strand:+ start:424 stop:618 length:195 start_codon:yes stop_codon:yes gene_type:complete
MDTIYVLILILIVIVTCQIHQPSVEEFGVLKRSVKQVKITFRCGGKLIKNSLGMVKDFVTFKWI